MAAWHYVTLSNEQRETLVSLTDTVVTRTDRFGNDVRIEITNWKNRRLYANFSINGKRDESQWISLEDSSDVKMQFSGDSNWLILETLINDEITRNAPAPVSSDTPDQDTVLLNAPKIVLDDVDFVWTEADEARAIEADEFWNDYFSHHPLNFEPGHDL